jgi:hypothetical protein
MTFSEIMYSYEAKIIKNANNLFKQQFLMSPDEVLCKIDVVECSY